MAEEYEEFDYVPDDLDDENDLQEKRIEESNRENKNKSAKNIETNINPRNTNTDEENYNFDTINIKKTDTKTNFSNYDEDEEEIKFDDINGESDYKSSQKNPTGRVENSLYYNNPQKRNLGIKIKNISSIPVNDNLNSSSHTNNNHLNISTNEINNNNKYYNNSMINKDIYQTNDISRLETYNNVSRSNVKYNNQMSDKINLSQISQSITPKNVNSSKHYMNIENNLNMSKNFNPNFNNESHISNNNRIYYSQNKGDRNKSYLDSMNKGMSPLNNQLRKGQPNYSNEINNYNFNVNNNSYISYKMPSVLDMNSRMTRVGNNNIYSKLQYAEIKYDELKNFYSRIQQNFSDRKIAELENNSNVDKQKVHEFISKQNYELLKYIDNLNKIINIVIDSSKVPHKNTAIYKNKKYPPVNNNSINEVNNNKLVEVFRKEHLKLDHRFKQISDPNYDEKLEETLAELKDQINFYDTENKKLKISQKQSEAMFERQYKNNNLTLQSKNLEINKVNIEYENTRKLNENVLEKIQKNKISIADKEQKTIELNEWLSKLETIARDMYGITEFMDKENIKKFEKAEKQKNDLKIAMKKKTEVLEKVLFTNKKKFEGEIIKNEKTIGNLEKQKMDLMKQIKEKTEVSKALQMKVRQLYSQYDNSLEMFNMNSSNNNEDFNNPNNQSNENNEFKTNAHYQSDVVNLPRNDQSLENDNKANPLQRSQNNPNIMSQNIQNNSNIINLKDHENNIEDKVKLMNGRITIENENMNNLNVSKMEVLENLEKISQNNVQGALDTQNIKLNKPNFKFNVNLNHLNNNVNNNIIPITNSDIRNSANIGENRLNNTNSLIPKNEKRENISKPFRINSTNSKINENDNNQNYFLIPNNPSKDLYNGSNLNIIDQAEANNSRINTENNNLNEENTEKNIVNINSRRRNFNQNNKTQNETIYSKKDQNLNKESNNNLAKIDKNKDLLNDNSNEKIPTLLTNNKNINPVSNFDNINEIREINPINAPDKNPNLNKVNQNSSKNIYDLSKREKLTGKEKRNILQNMFSDDNDDIINIGEDEKFNMDVNDIENKIDEKRKEAFDNLFKENDKIQIPNNRFKLQMNKENDNDIQKKSIYNENDNINNKNIIKKYEKAKNILDELEDIVL
jgi:hypothetical protein